MEKGHGEKEFLYVLHASVVIQKVAMKKHHLLIIFTFVIILFLINNFYLKNTDNLDHISLASWKETSPSPFKKQQIQFERVRETYAKKEIHLKKLLTSKGIHSFDYDLFLRAFKTEEILEVWIKNKNASKYQLLIAYPFCKNSGSLGPKRVEGDGQIPEGFYRISNFNPKSNFLLSLKVNYPNDSDRILSDPIRPGNDIYLHGGCQTIGCIPITNDKIQELYLLAVEAHEAGKSILIHIFPTKHFQNVLMEGNLNFSFWKNLEEGFDFFEKNKELPKVEVLENGKYNFP